MNKRRTRGLAAVVVALTVALGLVVVAPSAVAAAPYTPACTITVNPATINPGKTVTITATGYNPHQVVTFRLSSTPPVIAQGTTDANGNVSATMAIPADLAPGSYTISAPACNGAVQSTELAVVAGQDIARGTTGSLPRTGSDLGWLLRVGVLLVVIGGAAALVARKRQQAHSGI